MANDLTITLLDDLFWIETVNSSIDLRKLDQKTLISLIYELRGRAKEARAKALGCLLDAPQA